MVAFESCYAWWWRDGREDTMGLVVIRFLFSLFLGGLLLWGAIKVVDRGNSKNTLGAAIGWNLIIAFAGMAPFVGAVAGLVVFVMVCFRYYDLGVLRTIGVLVVEIGLVIGLSVAMGSFEARHADIPPSPPVQVPAETETK